VYYIVKLFATKKRVIFQSKDRFFFVTDENERTFLTELTLREYVQVSIQEKTGKRLHFKTLHVWMKIVMNLHNVFFIVERCH